MTDLLILRHGPTAWNTEGLIQGRTDVPLSPHGEGVVRTWVLPDRLRDRVWIASPLQRAAATAGLLGLSPSLDARLVEMDWGVWEGRTLTDLRAELGDLMAAWEARGLDFRAPEGESPLDVQDRLRPWLAEVAGRGEPTGAVAHKGVIRALYALAADWDMTDKPRHKLLDGCAHRFTLAPDGAPAIAELNIALEV
ncbi:phosphoglycerate mutase [Skermanella stibiiresistens SB22]|uniref:Phosphoglycerate mutase n=1 Tax=Skermanella stibiiresistens SB22 TaxID=1385369 RepID=W9H7I3_9PROT|nr:histidine phosphatase family protein [Skermanella stibiiresistens]EWY40632.1 phosphoglycerate mutase [Skermanella stibiiresistens SB22]